jgi:hypothetical protein
MSAQSRADRKWPVGRIELEGARNRVVLNNPVLYFALLLCVPALRLARIVLVFAHLVAQTVHRPLLLVLRSARRLPLLLHCNFAPFTAAFGMFEELDAAFPTHGRAFYTHNSFPPGNEQFFASFAAVPVG